MEVRGVDLAVEDTGTGTPVLWGHGLTSSMAAEAAMGLGVVDLPEVRYRVVRYDARGHGDSGGTTDPDDYAYPSLAADELGLADALGIDRFVVGGMSMGSATALHTAVAAPDRVLALVLGIPPTAWEGRQARGAAYRDRGRIIEEEGLEAFIELAMAEPLADIFAPFAELVTEGIRARYESYDPEILAPLLTGVGGSDLPGAEAVAELTMPVLVLAWAGDPVHPQATAERLGELLRQAEIVVASSLRDVLAWSGLVREFLDRALA
ncbi:MAG TPA: alpha/beta fold hydrolase [Acidimicrobiales bacterium]